MIAGTGRLNDELQCSKLLKREWNPTAIQNVSRYRIAGKLAGPQKDLATKHSELFWRSYQDLIRSSCVLERGLRAFNSLKNSSHTPTELKAILTDSKLESVKKALHATNDSIQSFNVDLSLSV